MSWSIIVSHTLLLRAGRCYGVLEETLPLSSHTIQDDGQILKGCARGKDGFSERSWHLCILNLTNSLASAINGPNNELNKKHISGHLSEAKFFGPTPFCPSSRLCPVPFPICTRNSSSWTSMRRFPATLAVREAGRSHRVVTSRHLGFALRVSGWCNQRWSTVTMNDAGYMIHTS